MPNVQEMAEAEAIEAEAIVADDAGGDVAVDVTAPADVDEAAVPTVGEAASNYFAARAKKIDQGHRVAVTRFVSWCGPSRLLSDLTPHQMTQFQESVGENAADLEDRLLPVKDFFAFVRRRTWSETNLGIHLRVKRTAAKRASKEEPALEHEQAVRFEMTPDGLTHAREELERLLDERPGAAEAVALAMEDKDFRENAPLDAARDHQAHLEARIRELEYQIGHAEVVDAEQRASTGMAQLGSTVHAINLEGDRTVHYTLVGQNEVDAAAGRISVQSPVGQSFVGRAAGDIVEVVAPSGTIRFRIESVEG